MTSRHLGNTLVLEWSAKSTIDNDKEDQTRRYSEITGGDLTSVLAVPVDSATTHDIVLILRDVAVTAFVAFLTRNGWLFPVLRFEQRNSKYLLGKSAHTFKVENTDQFFEDVIEFERIPLRYIPFSLEEINHAELVTPVIRHLTSLIVRDVEEVTLIQFCSAYVPAWSFISAEKQREIRNNTRQILAEFARDRVGQELLKRDSDDSSRWLLHQNDEFDRRMRFFRNHMERFAARKRGDSDQLEIPFDEE